MVAQKGEKCVEGDDCGVPRIHGGSADPKREKKKDKHKREKAKKEENERMEGETRGGKIQDRPNWQKKAPRRGGTDKVRGDQTLERLMITGGAGDKPWWGGKPQ